jgi:hypothetical protein
VVKERHRLGRHAPLRTWCDTPTRLPRKEVIQPHLPVRLPCYDFTPVTDPTLDSCPCTGQAWQLAHRLQVLSAPMV